MILGDHAIRRSSKPRADAGGNRVVDDADIAAVLDVWVFFGPTATAIVE